ncbi:MAG TPA: FAD-dependent oxidoreductase [Thermoleophilaceae bacterium]|nr:FAD-dependent oxidoreductase [Thermoleophilaceae bacterium]
MPGADLDGLLYLRDLEDAQAIRERIARGGKLVVIGAGWIGAEVAASARDKDLEVTIVAQGNVPLERVLGPQVGEIFRDVHAEHGVELLAGAGLEAFEGGGTVERVRLADGRTVECDFVVAGIGVVPRAELAERAGLEVDNGVVVDERLESSSPGIFAAGDVANARHPVFGRLRVEHWSNALNQGPAAARAMLGRGQPYDRVPYFFSDQYDIGMEYAGHGSGTDEVVFRGDPASREFMAFWLREGRVAAGMNVNVWEVTEAVQALVRSGIEVDRSQLADPGVRLEDLGTERPTTSKPAIGLRKLATQGARFPKRFLQARFAKADDAPVSSLANGEARILQVDGTKAACYRDEDGLVHACSPVCTHMGCLVDWNAGERTWDCPCHGSRFDPDGRLLEGPAKKPLKEVHMDETSKAAAAVREGR